MVAHVSCGVECGGMRWWGRHLAGFNGGLNGAGEPWAVDECGWLCLERPHGVERLLQRDGSRADGTPLSNVLPPRACLERMGDGLVELSCG